MRDTADQCVVHSRGAVNTFDSDIHGAATEVFL
jgi:hypothetical protein